MDSNDVIKIEKMINELIMNQSVACIDADEERLYGHIESRISDIIKYINKHYYEPDTNMYSKITFFEDEESDVEYLLELRISPVGRSISVSLYLGNTYETYAEIKTHNIDEVEAFMYNSIMDIVKYYRGIDGVFKWVY